jgi:uncharacterized protein YgiM (DUF1202 family)
LYKKQYIFGAPVKKSNLTIVDYKEVSEGIFMVFYDTEKRIRKYITTSNFPEGNTFTVHYFDADGYEVHSVFLDPQGRVGNQYTKKNNLVYLNMVAHDENYEIVETIEQYGGKTDLFYVLHTDNIKKDHLNEHLKLNIATDPKVTFSPPKANDVTITNVRRANLRKEPSTTAERLTVVTLGEFVEILEHTNDEWYKVNVNGQVGYIFAELLEPVERVIK